MKSLTCYSTAGTK